MTAVRAAAEAPVVYGRAQPRLAPPVPARTDLAAFRKVAVGMGITLMPWQEIAGKFLTATNADGGNLYREVCIVIARQNGKTTLMKPLIVKALRDGKRVMHIAQTRELPRHMFRVIADALSNEPELFPKRRGKTLWPRFGAGQEEIVLQNGGMYRIAAAGTGGTRGWTNDLVIIDELREMESFDIIDAAEPTVMTTGGQMVYLSNAGNDRSVVINAARERSGRDPDLAYLEWSAAPERERDDIAGWREANPSMGHIPSIIGALESRFRAANLAGTPAKFETEHLCRWVVSDTDPLVDIGMWTAAHNPRIGIARRPYMGVAVDPDGTRASAAMAWRRPDKSVAVTVLEHGIGSPLDPDLFGARIRELARDRRILLTGFDPGTDAFAAKYLHRSKSMTARDQRNATAAFVNLLESGKLVWADADAVTEDLAYTTRKEDTESGAFTAVRARDDVPITAVLAAIRAVGLAAEPPQGKARIY